MFLKGSLRFTQILATDWFFPNWWIWSIDWTKIIFMEIKGGVMKIE